MNYIEFIPAELNEIMGKLGFSWPSHLPMSASGGEYRSFEEICTWNDIDPATFDFKTILDILVNGRMLVETVRIARRSYRDSWKAYQLSGENKIVAFSGLGGEIALAWFDSKEEFWSWLLGDFVNYPLPEIPKAHTDTMSASEFAFHCALCDFFLRSFPIPDIEWAPEVPLVFSATSLKIDMQISDGWTAAWKDLAGLPDLSEEDIEELAFIMCNEQKLQAVDMPDGSTVFMIGNELTWLIRSMAWWDRGVVLKNEDQTAYLLQASTLWLFANEGKFWEAAAISGEQLKKIASNFNGGAVSISTLEERPANNEMKYSETTATSEVEETENQRFCHKCGEERQPEDVFCRFCGAKL